MVGDRADGDGNGVSCRSNRQTTPLRRLLSLPTVASCACEPPCCASTSTRHMRRGHTLKMGRRAWRSTGFASSLPVGGAGPSNPLNSWLSWPASTHRAAALGAARNKPRGVGSAGVCRTPARRRFALPGHSCRGVARAALPRAFTPGSRQPGRSYISGIWAAGTADWTSVRVGKDRITKGQEAAGGRRVRPSGPRAQREDLRQ